MEILECCSDGGGGGYCTPSMAISTEVSVGSSCGMSIPSSVSMVVAAEVVAVEK